MNQFMRRIAVVIGATAVSVGLMAATAVPVQTGVTMSARDSSWGR